MSVLSLFLTEINQVLLRWLEDKGEETRSMTWKEVDTLTTNLARCMISPTGWALKKGDRALLVYPPSLDFIICFIACLKAGIVAVPVFPPDPRYGVLYWIFLCHTVLIYGVDIFI